MSRFGERALVVLAALTLAIVSPSPARSADPSDSLSLAPPSWDVTLGRETLFSIATPFRNVSPAERARLISERLESLARTPQFQSESLHVVETEVSSNVQSGIIVALNVLADDTLGTGLDRHALAVQRLIAVRAGIERYRERRSSRSVGWAIGRCLVATLALALALLLLGALRRRVDRRLQRWIGERRERIKQRTYSMLEPDRLLAAVATLLKLLAALLGLFALYAYASYVLEALPWTSGLGAQLREFVLAPLSAFGNGFIHHLPGLVFIAVVAIVTRYVLKLADYFFAEIGNGHIRFDKFYPEWADPTGRIARVVIVALAFVVAYPFIPGSDSLAFKGISIFLGVLVSLGSSSTVGNLVAGIMIVYMRSYRVGDIIQIGDHMGRVIETDVLATRLRTPWNVEITIPNSTMISSNVVNYSREAAERGLILHTEVSIGYNAPWRQVHAMLLRAAALTDGILGDPAPYVLQRQLGDFAITYQINGYTREPMRMLRIYHELHRNIQDQFNEHGVEIMTPHFEGDRETPAVVPKDQWYAPPAIPKGQPGADE